MTIWWRHSLSAPDNWKEVWDYKLHFLGCRVAQHGDYVKGRNVIELTEVQRELHYIRRDNAGQLKSDCYGHCS